MSWSEMRRLGGSPGEQRAGICGEDIPPTATTVCPLLRTPLARLLGMTARTIQTGAAARSARMPAMARLRDEPAHATGNLR